MGPSLAIRRYPVATIRRSTSWGLGSGSPTSFWLMSSTTKSLGILVSVGSVTRLLRVRWAASRLSTSRQVPAGRWRSTACWCTINGLVCQALWKRRTRA